MRRISIELDQQKKVLERDDIVDSSDSEDEGFIQRKANEEKISLDSLNTKSQISMPVAGEGKQAMAQAQKRKNNRVEKEPEIIIID